MLVTHLDRNYLPFGKLYLLSAAKNAPDERVYVSAANLTTAEVGRLQTYNRKAIIVNHVISIPEEIRYRQYMQCRISKVLVEAHDKFGQHGELCIATNVDMLIRKPMSELYSLIKDKDILLLMDKEHLVANEILNEVMVLDFDSPVMSAFLTAYNKMWDNGVVYRDDQRQLYKVFNELTDVNFGKLPLDYTDRFMQPESHIWSARRHNRFYNYNKFLSELGLPEEKTCTNLSWIGKSDGRKEAN